MNKAHWAGILSFIIWGLSPLYWKLFPELSAYTLFVHRFGWAFIFLGILSLFKKNLSELKLIWNNKRNRYLLLLSGCLISLNWYLYVYAISSNQVIEASLGYFLNPLMNVFLGWIILKEKIRNTQFPSLLLALIALIYLGSHTHFTTFPWLALSLALTFATYGLFRKILQLKSLEALSFETLLIFPPFIVLSFILNPGQQLILKMSDTLMLTMSGFLTIVPLILFSYAAKRIPLKTLGFIQYLSPSLKFICGWIIFKEPLLAYKLNAFIIIWIALLWYSLEGLWHSKSK